MTEEKDREFVPPKDLAKKILRRVERVERRDVIIKAVVFGAILAGSVAFAVIAGFEVVAEASRSGFLAFTSLFFSDFSLALANFSDLMLSIVESFPVFSAALLLSGVFFGVWSAAQFVNEVMLLRENAFSIKRS